jgi:hypothetical protein
MKLLDETMILRFASGEMAAEDESNFLARCEIAPDSWRSAALAVAEHRRMVEALGEMAATETIPATVGNVKTGFALRRSPLLMAAAALAIGLLLGIVGTRVNGFVKVREVPVATAPPAEQQPKAAVATEPDPASAVLTDTSRKAPAMPEVHPAVLRTHDVEVKEEPTLYIVTAKDGTRWAIPVQQTTFCYVNR